LSDAASDWYKQSGPHDGDHDVEFGVWWSREQTNSGQVDRMSIVKGAYAQNARKEHKREEDREEFDEPSS